MKSRFITVAFFSLSMYYAQSQTKPNIILINMDDMGYGDTEPYGMTGIPTPNFNKLAQQGMRFTHFNATQPVCSASRAALLTGCYSNRVGISGALMPTADIALNPEEETIASLLKQVGYTTAMLGKWHLGSKSPYLPLHYGFDSFFGLPYSNDMWPNDYLGNPVTDPNNRKAKHPPLPLIEGDHQVDSILNMDDQGRLTTLFTDRAVNFINTNKDVPFFLYLAHPMPHAPIAASDQFKGKSELGTFGDVIMELDWSLGEIMATLEEAGIAENTILIVTSDNGPWLNFGDHAGSSGGFKEGKNTTWDGGTRVPLIIRWPDKIEAGTVNSSLMTNMDILPTIIAATGAPMPEKEIDGMNFLPVLLGESREGPREVFYYYFGRGNLEGIRYQHWKLVLPHQSGTYTALHGKGGNPGQTGRVEVTMGLYDLAHDPGEDYDVQELYPDIVSKLLKIADEARNDLGDGLTNIIGKNVRLPANVD